MVSIVSTNSIPSETLMTIKSAGREQFIEARDKDSRGFLHPHPARCLVPRVIIVNFDKDMVEYVSFLYLSHANVTIGALSSSRMVPLTSR